MDALIIFGAKYLVVFIALAAVIIIFFKKDVRFKLGLVLLIALPLGYALARLAGMFFSHHQPFAEQGFAPLIPHDVDNSFPSDHTLISGVFATVAYVADKRVGLVLWFLTFAVGLSRILAGLHWGVDVLVAAAIAIGAVYVSGFAASFFIKRS